MLGDTGVAVNPEDERYKAIIGKHVILPIVGRKIPIVADNYADPTAGTGAVKVTPAHDFNDFDVAKRTGLRAINVLNTDASVTIKDNEDFLEGLGHPAALHGAWDRLEGQDRFTARKIIVEIFEEAGLLDKIEPHIHTVPHGDRGGVPIEPRLTEQWWVDNKTLAEAAPSHRSAKAAPSLFRRTGRTLISSGWRTSSPGAFPASSGGAIRSRPGTVRTARSSSRKPRRRRCRLRSSITSRTKAR